MQLLIQTVGVIIAKANRPKDRVADRKTGRQKLSHPIQRNYLGLTFVIEPVQSGRPKIRAIFQCQHYSAFEQQAHFTVAPCEYLSRSTGCRSCCEVSVKCPSVEDQ